MNPEAVIQARATEIMVLGSALEQSAMNHNWPEVVVTLGKINSLSCVAALQLQIIEDGLSQKDLGRTPTTGVSDLLRQLKMIDIVGEPLGEASRDMKPKKK